MPHIHLETFIQAPPFIVFDISRSIDMHQSSMKRYNERAVAGVQSGMMNKGDTVTWQAKHLLRNRTLKVKMVELETPTFFADEMLEGDFKKMRHEHHFRRTNDGTVMIDDFYFESPFGILGRIVNALFLTSYMRKLLLERNKEIKQKAEGGE